MYKKFKKIKDFFLNIIFESLIFPLFQTSKKKSVMGIIKNV